MDGANITAGSCYFLGGIAGIAITTINGPIVAAVLIALGAVFVGVL